MTTPDIVFMHCHDLGRRLSVYGQSGAKTPGLSRLASEGIVFDNAFSTSTLCSPSRGSVCTGRYPHEIGLLGLTNRGWDLGADEKAIPAYLNEAGYDTILFGIQHEAKASSRLGYRTVVPRPTRQLPRASEVAAQAADYLSSLPPRAERAPVYVNVGFFEPHRHDFWENYTPIDKADVKVPAYLPDTDGVRTDLARYDGLVEAMDEGVDRVLAALDVAGLTQDALVLFTTDHGIPFPGAKTNLYDPGIEVSALARWPGRIAAGRRSDALVSHVDWLPTLLEVAGTDVPHKVRGTSFLPVLLGQAPGARDTVYGEATYHAAYDPVRCVRTRDFKLIRNYDSHPPFNEGVEVNPNNGVLAIDDYPASLTQQRAPWELFDLREDPLERKNVAGESDYASVQAELQEKLTDWSLATADPVYQLYAAFTQATPNGMPSVDKALESRAALAKRAARIEGAGRPS